MNKKIYGLIAVGVAAGFWACGSGEFLEPNELTDGIMRDVDGEAGIISDVMNVNNCPQCFVGGPSQDTPVTPPPSSTSYSSSNDVILPPSSSSEKVIRSSSSRPPVLVSSSSGGLIPIVSSSSSAGGSGDARVGTCAPETPTVEIGDKVTWRFTRGTIQANQLLKAKFDWTFEGGTPASATVEGGPGISQTNTYSTSGQKIAKLVISIGASVYPIECAPLQVNGAPITGCKCEPDTAVVDVAKGEIAKWTVSGCTSVGAEIIGYTWSDGVVGDGVSPTGTAVFTEKGADFAPSVIVANNDNTMQNFTCGAVKPIDSNSPDYEIKEAQATGAIDIPSGKEISVKISAGCPNKTFFCNGNGAEVGGIVNGMKMAESWYTTATISESSCNGGTITVNLTGNGGKCGVQ